MSVMCENVNYAWEKDKMSNNSYRCMPTNTSHEQSFILFQVRIAISLYALYWYFAPQLLMQFDISSHMYSTFRCLDWPKPNPEYNPYFRIIDFASGQGIIFDPIRILRGGSGSYLSKWVQYAQRLSLKSAFWTGESFTDDSLTIFHSMNDASLCGDRSHPVSLVSTWQAILVSTPGLADNNRLIPRLA